MQIGIDVGGTFTDAVLVNQGEIVRTVKTPTAEDHLLGSVLAGFDQLLQGVPAEGISRVALSTTLVTNAIVRQQTDPVGLLILPGPGADWSGRIPGEPVALTGYVDHRGRIRQEISQAELDAYCGKFGKMGLYAVSGKFSVRNPELENRIANRLTQTVSPQNVTCGAAVSGGLNFIRRTNSAYYNAAVWLRFQAFADAVVSAMQQRNIVAPIFVLKADGGSIPLQLARRMPVEAIFTGPAASILGVMALCDRQENFVSLDIGGTTTDIALWRNGTPIFDSRGAKINGYHTAVRTFRLQSIGLGGDSWVRRAQGRIRVGPERKGPAMALGGEVPTLTDALIVCGDCQIGDRSRAEQAMSQLSDGSQPLDVLASEVAAEAVKTICAAVKSLMAEEEASPVYRVDDIVRLDHFRPQSLVGVGGGAQGLAMRVAQAMSVSCRIPEHAMVANALGAALARPTQALTLRMDTTVPEYLVPEMGLRRRPEGRQIGLAQARQIAFGHLQEMALQAGMEVPEAEAVFEEEFNVVRGFSTTGKILNVGVQIKPGILSSFQRGKGERGHGE